MPPSYVSPLGQEINPDPVGLLCSKRPLKVLPSPHVYVPCPCISPFTRLPSYLHEFLNCKTPSP